MKPKRDDKAQGGSLRTPMLKTGIPESPLTKARKANGIPGMKTGGNVKGKKC